MTKKIKVYLLIILAAMCAACAFAGCKVGRPGREEVLAGYKAHVTYYANGGYFNSSTTITVSDLYFMNNSSMEGYNPDGIPFFDISSDTSGMNVAKKGYDLVGWYLPARYSDTGEIMYTYTYTVDDEQITVPVFPVYDENGNAVTDSETDRPVFAREGVDEQILEGEVTVVASDEVVTSERLVADDENLTVCAKWAPTLKIIYKLVCEEGKTYTDASGKEYTNGSVLRSDEFGNGSEATPTSLAPVALAGATFVRSYSDEELTTLATQIVRPEGDDVEDPVVYSKYIDGEGWTIVGGDSSSISSMFNSLGSSYKYYLIGDVDCSSRSFTLKRMNTNNAANATIVGNGYTLSNLNFTVNSSIGQGDSYSIFGVIGDNFSVTDLKLENVTITVRAGQNFSLYAICNTVSSNATLDGLEIDGITATVTQPAENNVTNAQNGIRTNWLFGNGTTDEEFLAAHTGVKVTGENTLTIAP